MCLNRQRPVKVAPGTKLATTNCICRSKMTWAADPARVMSVSQFLILLTLRNDFVPQGWKSFRTLDPFPVQYVSTCAIRAGINSKSCKRPDNAVAFRLG